MEIERKFLIKSLPLDVLNGCEYANIEQSYLDFGEGDEPERRIRKLVKNGEAEYIYTEKGEGELCREEEEYEISEYSYKKLKELVISSTIEKRRYYIFSAGLTVEVDLYGGSLEGLNVAEVEFSSVEESEGFTPPEWFGEEITYDKTYRNKNLAKI